MSLSAIIFIFTRKYLPYLFISDEKVVSVAAMLLIVAAIFQVFDGLQVVMLSTLRGMADVTRPMFIAFFAYLLLGIPTSYVFAFVLKVGPMGIWFGYLAGLGIAAIMFYLRFRRNLKNLGDCS
jgi:MATE family multidrug resistance protein